MDYQFKVGQYAIPKKKSTHENFENEVGKRFRIIRIDKNCDGKEGGGCAECPGDPIVILHGRETSLCGFGAPDKNFLFEPGDWDI